MASAKKIAKMVSEGMPLRTAMAHKGRTRRKGKMAGKYKRTTKVSDEKFLIAKKNYEAFWKKESGGDTDGKKANDENEQWRVND